MKIWWRNNGDIVIIICAIIAILYLNVYYELHRLDQVQDCSGCGLKPLKPLPPIGCKDLKAVCRCDEDGCNCKWEWDCVPYK